MHIKCSAMIKNGCFPFRLVERWHRLGDSTGVVSRQRSYSSCGLASNFFFLSVSDHLVQNHNDRNGTLTNHPIIVFQVPLPPIRYAPRTRATIHAKETRYLQVYDFGDDENTPLWLLWILGLWVQLIDKCERPVLWRASRKLTMPLAGSGPLGCVGGRDNVIHWKGKMIFWTPILLSAYPLVPLPVSTASIIVFRSL